MLKIIETRVTTEFKHTLTSRQRTSSASGHTNFWLLLKFICSRRVKILGASPEAFDIRLYELETKQASGNEAIKMTRDDTLCFHC